MQRRFSRSSCARAMVLVALPAFALGACARPDRARAPAPPAPVDVPVDVLADSTGGGAIRLTPTLPAPGAATGARVWLARVSPVRSAPLDAPLPNAARESLDAPPAEPPPLAVDPDLKPPIPRDRARLTLPRGARPGVVELDVRIDERGDVSDAMWAGGARDSALVFAATTCALGMRFRPAERAGLPVAVWCRQRFDFTR